MAIDQRTIDNISVVTNDHIIPAIVNQILVSNYLAKQLLGKSKPVSGGDRIKQPLEYGEEIVQWLGEYDKVNFQTQELLTAAFYEWMWINGTISLSEMDMKIKNAGKEAIMDLVEVKSKNLARTYKRSFGKLLFKNSPRASNEPYTLYDIIVNNTGAVGGIDASLSQYAWWKAKKLTLTSVTYAQLKDPSSKFYLENVFAWMYGKLTIDADHPTLIVTTQDIWDTYERLLHEQNRYQGMSEVDGAFELLKFRGSKVVVDSHVPDGHAYFLNEDYLGFRHSSSSNFAFTPFDKVGTGQHVYVAELDWHGAFTCSNRAMQGVITGIPTNTLTLS